MYTGIIVKVLSVLQKEEEFLKLKTDGGAGRAILYLHCFPPVSEGEFVKVNTTAQSLDLGTGGWDFVTSTRHENYTVQGKGHIMKARYSPFQHSVFSIDDPEHPDHDIFEQPFSLHQAPVLLAELHSMLPVLLGAVSLHRPDFRIGVILSDESSLAAGLSDHMNEWKRKETIDVVTVGQAFGGTAEAVTLINAMQWLITKRNADLLIISMGPGTVGTGTRFGFSGMALAEWANITGALDGMPVWIPRLSFSEKRQRHYGLSHHTITPLCYFTYAFSTLILPRLDKKKAWTLKEQARPLLKADHVELLYQETEQWFLSWQEHYKNREAEIFSMGTLIDNDPEFIQGILAPLIFSVKKQEERHHGI
ncbi:DUF3866 family protein [Salibacterium aidingense]|uniref:DUF3866 family protein n=1 Tax=Salibacterium aidingense TaxID=384933 RepID=UPI003BBFD1E3